MNGCRQIDTGIWSDEYFLDLSADEKLILIYLFSNSHDTASLNLKVAEFETGIGWRRIADIIADLADEMGRLSRLFRKSAGDRKSRKHNRNMKSQQLARKRTINARGSSCESCGKQGYVEAHHIIPVCEGGTFNDDNLLLLCPDCHKKAHGSNTRPR